MARNNSSVRKKRKKRKKFRKEPKAHRSTNETKRDNEDKRRKMAKGKERKKERVLGSAAKRKRRQIITIIVTIALSIIMLALVVFVIVPSVVETEEDATTERKKLLSESASQPTIKPSIRPSIKPSIRPITEDPAKPVKPRNKSVNMSEVCRNADKSGCFYYSEKFVTNCSVERCSSLLLVPKFAHPSENSHILYVEFFNEKTEIEVTVPDGIPCQLPYMTDVYGYCENKLCQPKSNDKELEELQKVHPINGKWKNVPSMQCFSKDIENITEKQWRMFEDGGQNCNLYRVPVKDGEGCRNHRFQMRDCTNPLPALGGKPCWGDEKMLTVSNWPLKISYLCDSCKLTDHPFTSMPAGEGLPCTFRKMKYPEGLSEEKPFDDRAFFKCDEASRAPYH